MENITKKIIEIISNAENINRLPLYDDLIKEFSDEDLTDSFDELLGIELQVKDGTKITIEKDGTCFADNNHWDFYYIKDIDTYICIYCGLPQKLHEIDEFTTLLPAKWSKHGIEAYLQRILEKPRIINCKLNGDCSNCKHMKNNECEFGNEEYTEACDDWEERR